MGNIFWGMCEFCENGYEFFLQKMCLYPTDVPDLLRTRSNGQARVKTFARVWPGYLGVRAKLLGALGPILGTTSLCVVPNLGPKVSSS